MSNNREVRIKTDHVHMLMGLKRAKFSPNSEKQCIRHVIKNEADYDLDVKILESKLLLMGGEWRIHRTINARDVKKAGKFLMHRLIDDEDVAGYIDSEWRTALLQKEHIFGERKFMLDIDTQDESAITQIELALKMSNAEVLERIKSPKGWHYVTKPFDTRIVCGIRDVSFQRDGYVYVKTVGKPDENV